MPLITNFFLSSFIYITLHEIALYIERSILLFDDLSIRVSEYEKK